MENKENNLDEVLSPLKETDIESNLGEQDDELPFYMLPEEERMERVLNSSRWYEGAAVCWVDFPKSKDEYRVIDDHGETFVQRVVKSR